ncbi:MAG: CBS domain-containing protein, partial [Ekhidna sp.]
LKVTDKDAAIMTRRLAREEGLFIGWSCGSAVFGALEFAKGNLKEDDVMVIILPDHGTRYLGKVYNDDWMKDHGFLEERKFATAKDIIQHRNGSSELVTINQKLKVGEAIKTMNQKGIDQAPIVDGSNFVGSISDSRILSSLIENPELKDKPVADVMDKSFQFVSPHETIDVMSSMLNRETKALLVRDQANDVHIITQSDLLVAMTN